MTAARTFFSRKAFTLALILSPMLFMGAECDPTGPANTPLTNNAMRAEVTGDGSFVCDNLITTDLGSFWKVVAQGGTTVGRKRIELDIPKQATVPYTVNVASDSRGTIYYCVPLSSSSETCKNYFADDENGSGTITITSIAGVLEGTFRGTVQTVGGAESRSITSGEFKADL